ncbi:pseudouridine synthase [Bhargavaea cecembensis]|uniref:pseudouridine synthase n=1 Tax=Bhargavaea cecembensis TaxID=394098 RepID=UPI00058D2823|nr:pseudouridine synthase [Bhargavaea cecembensis]
MERLQKVIAAAGIASRRKAEELISAGKVTVNGETVTELGTKVGRSDKIEVEGIRVEQEEKVYYLLYKPRAVLSASSDDRGRKTVTDLFPEVKERLYPVGRLDYDTTGILLLTNDGEFAYQMTHPKFNIDKTYVARVKGIPTKEQLKQLEKGIVLEDGKTAPARAKLISMDKKTGRSIVSLTIHEGKNRQVKRMFEAIGCPVQKLKRESFGFLGLHGMNAGDRRELTAHEVKQLRVLAETGKIG